MVVSWIGVWALVLRSFLEVSRGLGLGLVMGRRLGCECHDIVSSPFSWHSCNNEFMKFDTHELV